MVLEENNTYRRVKQPARDPIKRPHVHRQGEAETQRHKEQVRRIRRGAILRLGCVGDLGADKGPEEEEERADKLADHGDGVVTRAVGETEHAQLVFMHLSREGDIGVAAAQASGGERVHRDSDGVV